MSQSVEQVQLTCIRLPGAKPWYGTRSQAQQVFDELYAEFACSRNMADIIISEAIKHWGITKRELLTTERTYIAANRRFIVYRLLRDYGYSMVGIGRLMPHHNIIDRPREHSCIAHGLDRFEELMSTDRDVVSSYRQIKRAIEARIKQQNNEQNGDGNGK